MRRTKNKNLYRVSNNVGLRKDSCKIIFGDDLTKSIVFINILKELILKEIPDKRFKGLNSIYVSGIGVLFNYEKDYDYFINKALQRMKN